MITAKISQPTTVGKIRFLKIFLEGILQFSRNFLRMKNGSSVKIGVSSDLF